MDLELRLQPDPSRLTLPRFLDDIVDRHGDRIALRFRERELSYLELAAEVRNLARALVGAGVVKGARVAVLMANRPEFVIAAFATARVGGVLVPVNTFATPEERDYILRHSDASFLLLQRGLAGRDYVEELEVRHPEIRRCAPGRLHCAALPQLRRLTAWGLEGPWGSVETVEQLLDAGREVPDSLVDETSGEVTPADDAMIIYTSGTTAHPKGIVHGQRAPVIQSWRFAEYMGLVAEDRIFTAQPFFWTAGLCMSLGATFAAGATLITQEVFDAEEALDLIEAERVTAVHAWPHQEKAMGEHPSAASRDLSSVRKIRVTSALAKAAGIEKDEWGMDASYGLSETFTICSALTANQPAELRKSCSGRPLPGMELRIVDPETGEPLAPSEHGEIAVRGVTLMHGYHKVDPALYLDADGFFRTQDGGSIDADGLLHWTGRLSNLIKTGGANVSPLEIEAAAAPIPGLRAALAVGVPHPVLGEVVVLCAVTGEGAAPTEEDVRVFLRSKLAAYKVPRRVLFFAPDELSYTGNQKIQVGPLREKALERLAAADAEIDGVRYGRDG